MCSSPVSHGPPLKRILEFSVGTPACLGLGPTASPLLIPPSFLTSTPPKEVRDTFLPAADPPSPCAALDTAWQLPRPVPWFTRRLVPLPVVGSAVNMGSKSRPASRGRNCPIFSQPGGSPGDLGLPLPRATSLSGAGLGAGGQRGRGPRCTSAADAKPHGLHPALAHSFFRKTLCIYLT